MRIVLKMQEPNAAPSHETLNFAVYRDEENPSYRDNLFIRALPPVPTLEAAFDALAHRPADRRDDFRTLDAPSRIDLLGQLQQVFVPTQQHIAALQKVVALVRACYEYRNPDRPEVQRCLYKSHKGLPAQIGRLSPTGGGSNGMVLWGVTGAGKTSFVDRLAEYLGNNPIYHRMVQGGASLWPQIPMLRIQCKGTLRGTSYALLQHLDQQLHMTHYSRLNVRWNRDDFLVKIQQAISIHFVGVLVIEDIHKLKDNAGVILEFLCDIMEECGIPVIAVSTYKFRPALIADPSVASKLTAKGVIDFEPLLFLPSSSSQSEGDPVESDEGSNAAAVSADWVRFVEALFNLNVFRHAVEMPAALPSWLHFHTMGVRRFAREMLVAAFERSVHDESITNIDLALLDSIAANELQKYQEAIHVLRRRSLGEPIGNDEAARFEHLLPPKDGLDSLAKQIEIRDKELTGATATASAPKKPRPSKATTKPLTGGLKPAPRKATTAKPRNAKPRTADEVYEGLAASGKIAG